MGIHPDEMVTLKRCLRAIEGLLNHPEPWMGVPLLLENGQTLDFSEMTAAECLDFAKSMKKMPGLPDLDPDIFYSLTVKMVDACDFVLSQANY